MYHPSYAVTSCQTKGSCLIAMQTENVDDLLNQMVPVKFLEIDQERDRLVFSARRAIDSKELKTYNVRLVAV